MSNYRQERFKEQIEHKKRKRWEFLALLLLLIPVLLGGMSLGISKPIPKPSATAMAMSAALQQGDGSEFSMTGRQIPKNGRIKGKVDDRYTLFEDPDTGKSYVHDSLGGMGTNNTSVDGDRLALMNDMIDLEKYADQNKGKLTKSAYNWLKRVSRTGAELAFGKPGYPPDAQPELKKYVLAEFHHISANPDQSLISSGKYQNLEGIFQKPDNAYVQTFIAGGSGGGGGGIVDIAGSSGALSSYLRPDPVSAPMLQDTTTALTSSSLTAVVNPINLSPTYTQLTSATSPFNMTAPLTTTVATTTGTVIDPGLTTGATNPTLATTSPTLATTSPTQTTADPTATNLFQTTLGVTAPTVGTPGTATTSPTTLDPSLTTSPTLTSSTATLSPSVTTSTVPLSGTTSLSPSVTPLTSPVSGTSSTNPNTGLTTTAIDPNTGVPILSPQQTTMMAPAGG